MLRDVRMLEFVSLSFIQLMAGFICKLIEICLGVERRVCRDTLTYTTMETLFESVRLSFSYDHIITRLHEHMTVWSYDHMATWLYDYMIE